jgi:short-subunit dehydrogenase
MGSDNSPSGDGGKNIIITGASRGLGYAIAEIFAENGNDLFLTSVTESKLSKAVAELQNKYPGIIIKAKPFDLSKKEQALAFGEWCLKNGSPDVLVNNAGSFAGSNVHNEEDGALEEMIETNLYSAYHLTRAIVPAMIEKKSGHIFNMSSIAGLKAYPNGGSYSIKQ